jgi:hypothetical protein
MDINKILAEAQTLMTSQDFWNKVNASEQSNKQGKKSVNYESNIFENDNSYTRIQKTTPIQERKKTGNPVLDSFIEKPPMTGELSQFDLNETLNLNLKTEPKPTMVETKSNVVYPQTVQIDYNYIKYLIDESIKEHMKSQINESASPQFIGMKLSAGNTFQFLDSKGNIYEGVLKLRKKRQ